MKKYKQLMKEIIIRMDNKIFKGYFRKSYKTIKERNESFFNGKKTVIINEPVSDMLLMQYNKNEGYQYQFYDIAVRVLAVENYYKKNNFGFELYEKMHKRGGNYGQINLSEEYYEKLRKKKKTVIYGKAKEQHSIEQFQNLIQSYEKNGYNENSYIMADRNLMNMNGSHRVALALTRGQQFINTEIHDLDFSRRFNIDWFWKANFERDELKVITDKMNSLLKEARRITGIYYCVLYPPAAEYFDEITKDIEQYDARNIHVLGYEDFPMEKSEFIGFVRTMYSFDSILQHNLERKLFYILKASALMDGKLPLRIISMAIENPMYRLKRDNGLPESVATVRLKQMIRERYKGKDSKYCKYNVDDYPHDVIIHSTDNYISNNAMKFLLEMDKDITSLFKAISHCQYALIESGIEKLPLNFPHDFYLNEDIDMLVSRTDLKELSEIIYDFCREKFVHKWIKIYCEDVPTGQRIWVKMRNAMLVMFDLMTTVPQMSNEFHSKCLEGRVLKSYFHVSLSDELSIRLAKYMEDRSKIHHVKYILDNINDFAFDMYNYSNPELADNIAREIIEKHAVGGGVEFSQVDGTMTLNNIVLSIDKNLNEIFAEMEKYTYALIQRGGYNQCIDFPDNYIIGEDVDIFIALDDIKQVAAMVKEMLDQKFSIYGIHTDIQEKKSGISVRACYVNDLIIEFDLITKMNSLSVKFMQSALDRSIVEGKVKRLSLNDEMNYRLAAFANSEGDKKYHAKFVIEHERDFSFLKDAFENPENVWQWWNKYKNEVGRNA